MTLLCNCSAIVTELGIVFQIVRLIPWVVESVPYPVVEVVLVWVSVEVWVAGISLLVCTFHVEMTHIVGGPHNYIRQISDGYDTYFMNCVYGHGLSDNRHIPASS